MLQFSPALSYHSTMSIDGKRKSLILLFVLLLALSTGNTFLTPVSAAEKFYAPDSKIETSLSIDKRFITPKCQALVEQWGCRISTVAGSGEPGFFRDGVPAIQAQLYVPSGVGIGPAGELYIADSGNKRVRKVDLAGTISTVAGNPRLDSYGQNGLQATETRVVNPTAVTVDGAGNIYFTDNCHYAESRECRIIKVDTEGIASTFAGKPSVSTLPSTDGPATEVPLYGADGLAINDGGTLFMAERGIRKVNNNGYMSTVAGTTGLASSWNDVAVDREGNVFIASADNGLIHRVSTAGIASIFAGSVRGSSAYGGPATHERLHYPIGIAIDTGGVVYIADYKNNRIFVVQRDGSEMCPLAGTGEPGYSGDGGYSSLATLNGPSDVAVAGDGTLYIADTANHVIRRVTCDHRPYGTLKELPRKVIKPKTIHRYR